MERDMLSIKRSKYHISLSSVISWYALLTGLCFFAWPVMLCLPYGPLRSLWICMTLALALLSIAAAVHFTRHARELSLPNIPWREVLPLLLLSLPLLIVLVTTPLRSFSDEAYIALPALTIFGHAVRFVPWPAFCAGFLIGVGLLFQLARRPRWAIATVIVFAAIALIVGMLTHETFGLAVRYPPIIHLLQLVTSVITDGNLSYVRLPTFFWTMLLIPVVWWGLPSWSTWQKYALLVGILFGPLAWTLRTELYQAPGELTIACVAALLLSRLWLDDNQTTAVLLALTLALWVLFRPTALISLLSIIGTLLLLRRWRSLGVVSVISLPPALAWIILYPFYRYGFLLSSNGLFPAAQHSQSLLQPLVVLLSSLPLILNPIVLLLLLILVTIALVRGSPTDRILLLSAMIVSLPTVVTQEMVLPTVFQGYARYALLLHLPLGVALGIVGGLRPQTISRAAAALATFLLLLVTPWNVVKFQQDVRSSQPDRIYHMPSSGDEVLPVSSTALRLLQQGKRPIILSPDTSFFDLGIASGYLTPQERTSLRILCKDWSPSMPTRPVLIQAPITTTYQPNIDATEENCLIAARQWALQQPTHTIIRLGKEEAVLVE